MSRALWGPRWGLSALFPGADRDQECVRAASGGGGGPGGPGGKDRGSPGRRVRPAALITRPSVCGAVTEPVTEQARGLLRGAAAARSFPAQCAGAAAAFPLARSEVGKRPQGRPLRVRAEGKVVKWEVGVWQLLFLKCLVLNCPSVLVTDCVT